MLRACLCPRRNLVLKSGRSGRLFCIAGCPKNRVDTEVMLGLSQQGGAQIAEKPDDADVIVVNTCGFINAAKEESIDTILEMAQWKTQGRCQRLIVTGCLTQRYPDELAREIPPDRSHPRLGRCRKITQAIRGGQRGRRGRSHAELHLRPRRAPPASQHAFSRYVKIAEAAIVPAASASSPSCADRSAPTLIRSPPKSSACRGSASSDQPRRAGSDDLRHRSADPARPRRTRSPTPPAPGQPAAPHWRAAAGDAPGWLRWIRLHYAYPTAVTDELLDVMATSPRVVKYLDVPLQHADDRVLKLMRRGHVGKTVWKLCERAGLASPASPCARRLSSVIPARRKRPSPASASWCVRSSSITSASSATRTRRARHQEP